MSCKERLAFLGESIKKYRINAGITQKDLEDRSGVSVRSISRLEQGMSVQTESLIKILDGLKLADNIELLIPDQTHRPSFYLDDKKRSKQRVRKKQSKKEKPKWGDEK